MFFLCIHFIDMLELLARPEEPSAEGENKNKVILKEKQS